MCGEQAAFRDRNRGFVQCEDCARFDGVHLLGEQYVALRDLAFAVQHAQSAGLTHDQMARAFGALMTGENEETVGRVVDDTFDPVPRGERWRWMFEPLRAPEAVA
jgi:hypothetical protein